MPSENLCRLKTSIENISHVENVFLGMIEQLPLGIILIEYPSRKCLLVNKMAELLFTNSLVGKKLFIHTNYIRDEEGRRYPCSKLGSYSFTVGDKHYFSLLLAKPKEEEAVHGKSSVWV